MLMMILRDKILLRHTPLHDIGDAIIIDDYADMMIGYVITILFSAVITISLQSVVIRHMLRHCRRLP